MEKRDEIRIGPIRIGLPDANRSGFSIFHDLAEVFGFEFQHQASKALKEALKQVKPKANIDHESDRTHITSGNPGTMVEVVRAIQVLATPSIRPEIARIELPELQTRLEFAKKNRPKPKPWAVGDVFSFTLNDGSFAFGQVLRESQCTCALLDRRTRKLDVDPVGLLAARVLAILHVHGDLLNTGQWRVIYNLPICADPDSGFGGKAPGIGSISFGGGGTIEHLANAYWGLSPWNVMAREDYFERMLQPGISRSADAVVLSPEDRKAYRLNNFGVE